MFKGKIKVYYAKYALFYHSVKCYRNIPNQMFKERFHKNEIKKVSTFCSYNIQ